MSLVTLLQEVENRAARQEIYLQRLVYCAQVVIQEAQRQGLVLRHSTGQHDVIAQLQTALDSEYRVR